MNFKGITAGARVTFWQRAGLVRTPSGIIPDYVKRTAKANSLLIFPTHVVVNHGNFGTVVDEDNYISHKP